MRLSVITTVSEYSSDWALIAKHGKALISDYELRIKKHVNVLYR